MKKLIQQYVTTGAIISEYQINKLSNNQLKSYLKQRLATEENLQPHEIDKVIDIGKIKGYLDVIVKKVNQIPLNQKQLHRVLAIDKDMTLEYLENRNQIDNYEIDVIFELDLEWFKQIVLNSEPSIKKEFISQSMVKWILSPKPNKAPNHSYEPKNKEEIIKFLINTSSFKDLMNTDQSHLMRSLFVMLELFLTKPSATIYNLDMFPEMEKRNKGIINLIGKTKLETTINNYLLKIKSELEISTNRDKRYYLELVSNMGKKILFMIKDM